MSEMWDTSLAASLLLYHHLLCRQIQKKMQVWYFSRCEILSGKVSQTERLKTNQDNMNMIKHQHLKVRLILTATKYVWEWSDTFWWNGLDFLLVYFASHLWCIYDLYHIIDVLLDLSLLFQSGIKWTHGGSNNTNPCFSSFSTSSPPSSSSIHHRFHH